MTSIDKPVFTASWHELPPSRDALRAECERLRNHILDNAKLALPALPCTTANFATLLKGERTGFMLPSLERLWLAARALDLNPMPSFAGEPQTARAAVAALDSLLAALDSPNAGEPAAGVGATMTNQTLKQPSKDALACYRLSVAYGGRQSELAEMMSRELGKLIDQPKVSRWLKQVKAWLKAGNVLPDVSEPDMPALKKKRSMDPAHIDRGIGRPKPTRRPSGDADSDDELQRLIAEQQADDD